VVVIGVGNPMRGDDGVGRAAVDELARSNEDDSVEFVAADGEATRLLELWRDRRLAVLIDAVVSGAPAGTVHRFEVGEGAELPPWSAGSSSHATGPAEAVALAETVGRLPGRLVIFGIEAAGMDLGTGLSPAVADALPTLVEQVRQEIPAAR
jgi:hydrogenase maturation protease